MHSKMIDGHSATVYVGYGEIGTRNIQSSLRVCNPSNLKFWLDYINEKPLDVVFETDAEYYIEIIILADGRWHHMKMMKSGDKSCCLKEETVDVVKDRISQLYEEGYEYIFCNGLHIENTEQDDDLIAKIFFKNFNKDYRPHMINIDVRKDTPLIRDDKHKKIIVYSVKDDIWISIDTDEIKESRFKLFQSTTNICKIVKIDPINASYTISKHKCYKLDDDEILDFLLQYDIMAYTMYHEKGYI